MIAEDPVTGEKYQLRNIGYAEYWETIFMEKHIVGNGICNFL